jgi:hypothetical protein
VTRTVQPCGTPAAYRRHEIGMLKRAYCRWFGHDWSRWSPWVSDGFVGLRHERTCRRCPAVEIQRDGEPGVVHA